MRSRLARALRSDEVFRIGSGEDLAPGTPIDAGRTWHFRADDVRDFAFATSDRYVWDAVGAQVGGERGRTLIQTMYDPEIDHWRDAAAFSKHSIEFFSRQILPYPYPHATAVFGPIGGMEYPMMVFIGRSRAGEPLYSVLAHEFSHEWFPMIVGSREAAFAWMDEGFTTFNEALARADFFGNENSRLQDQERYLQAARAEIEAPLMRHTDFVESGVGRGVAAYTKPATLLHALRRIMGEKTFDDAYAAYAEAWSYRHPYPWDFFAAMESAAGTELDWLWRAWFYDTATLDQAIETVSQENGAVRITVINLNDAVMPVELELELEDGTSQRVVWPAEVWAGTRRVTRRVDVPGRVVGITLDPDYFFLDIDRTNNVWPADPSIS
jgi:aminopeptidase N